MNATVEVELKAKNGEISHVVKGARDLAQIFETPEPEIDRLLDRYLKNTR